MATPPSLLAPFDPESGGVRVVVESPRGAALKIKYEPKLGLFTWKRPLPAGLRYPHDWGFVPGTEGPDGDPVDAMVLSDIETWPGLVIACRPIAVVRVEQNKAEGKGRQRNDRILAVPEEAPRWERVKGARDLPERTRCEIDQFFLASTEFEKKDVKILGWGNGDEARRLVRKSWKARGE